LQVLSEPFTVEKAKAGRDIIRECDSNLRLVRVVLVDIRSGGVQLFRETLVRMSLYAYGLADGQELEKKSHLGLVPLAHRRKGLYVCFAKEAVWI